jgi:putative serine protease PepD
LLNTATTGLSHGRGYNTVVQSGDAKAVGRTLGLVAAAVIGGLTALGGAALAGKLGSRTTYRPIVASPTQGSVPTSFAGSKALSIHQIYERWAPGVVQITSTTVVNVPQDPIFGNPFAPQQQEEQSLGSGFVIDKAGHVVTNYHVVEGAKSVQVSFSNGENVQARIIGTDPSTDIAVLQVRTHSRALTPLVWGNSDNAQVGDSVVAIGNPFGYTRSVTAGIVSALDRPLTAPNNFQIEHAIQTDAALNHGNSGGPLLDARGEVIGVNSQISTGNTGQQGNLGIGFAVPSNTVRGVVAQIVQSGHAEHAALNIKGQSITPSIALLNDLPARQGVLVANVARGSGAAEAGLKGATSQHIIDGVTWALGGDIIVSADGVPTPTVNRLSDVIAQHKPGDTIKLVIYHYHGDSKKTIEVKLGRQGSSP